MLTTTTGQRRPAGLNVFKTRIGVLAVLFTLAFVAVLSRLA
jgi:hypothetical protein